MNKKKIVLLVLVLLVIIGIMVLVQGLKKKSIEWTRENSLLETRTPELSDPKENDSLVEAIDLSLQYLQGLNPEIPVQLGPDVYSLRTLRETLVEFRTKLIEYGLNHRLYEYIKKNFVWYKTPTKEVIFTGYYEANLRGSLTRSDTFRFPLYRKPDDLVRIDLSAFYFFPRFPGLPVILRGQLGSQQNIIPYFTREEIDSKQKISGRNLEIVWSDNLIDVFFLHIQGSGVVNLDNGQSMRVNYAESNGHPYRAIGKLLIDRGILDQKTLSMQGIRKYLKNHPEAVEEILNYNPSYVFFEKREQGPLGTLGVPLTPYRSIATDHQLFPPAALAYVETEMPVYEKKDIATEDTRVKSWKKFSGFVLNQDTGGAIRGAGKIDLFTGSGRESEWIAGHMKQRGTFYFLIKKTIPAQ